MDEFRAELRKPTPLTNNLCDFVVAFVTRDSRLPNAGALDVAQRRKIVSRVAQAGALCAKAYANASYSPRPIAMQDASPDATALLGEIQTALDVAESSNDLAVRLGPVLAAAGSLSEVENAIVSATASIAQSSFDYWQLQYPAFEQEFGDEYGACERDRQANGYSYDDARNACLGGGTVNLSMWSWPTAPSRSFVLASRPSARPMCPGPGGFRKIAKADTQGAWSGGFGGAGGGPGGAALGAVAGSAGGSIWAAGENAFAALWCVMAQ